jgi:hypothetical protein
MRCGLAAPLAFAWMGALLPTHTQIGAGYWHMAPVNWILVMPGLTPSVQGLGGARLMTCGRRVLDPALLSFANPVAMGHVVT